MKIGEHDYSDHQWILSSNPPPRFSDRLLTRGGFSTNPIITYWRFDSNSIIGPPQAPKKKTVFWCNFPSENRIFRPRVRKIFRLRRAKMKAFPLWKSNFPTSISQNFPPAAGWKHFPSQIAFSDLNFAKFSACGGLKLKHFPLWKSHFPTSISQNFPPAAS